VELPVSVTGASAIEVAHRCAEAASAIIRQGYGNASLAGVKGRGNVVTETDFDAERIVLATLREQFPSHAILSEESVVSTRSEGWMWVVDPLDGTKNFSQAIPHFGFNLALCFGARPVLAVTTHPLLRDAFLAVEGVGTALNGEPTAVSDADSLANSVVAIDMGYDAERGGFQLELAKALWPGMQSLRITGSAALGFAYVASGRWDIYVHSDLQPWDIAAGLLLVREAGGVVRDRDGSEATIYSREAVAANPAVYADFERRAGALPWA
jgi:fructose-1,6-bisphosphatase/inositol monophosphatase family enzyme